MHKIINTALAFTLIVTVLLLGAPRHQRVAIAAASADTKEDRVALYQALVDLTNPFTVMCIAAHPDDEDGTSLTVLRHKYGVHTVSLFSTFGEGGQNAIGPELYEELGAIRVRETMAAAEIQGSEPHFLGMKDFGFSKSADEAFKFWGHDEPLRRMVLQIRQLRPDVIITNHDTTSGHGHHQATGRLELEAFDAAADPQRFPEQLKDGITTWRVQRLFVRAGFGGGPATNAAPQPNAQAGLVTIDPNEQDPVRGTTYAEQALSALQKHATQGPWPKTVADMARARNATDGRLPLIRYRLTREAKGAAALPADSHSVLEGLRLPDKMAAELAPPAIEGKPLTDFVDDRERVVNALIDARKNHPTPKPDQKSAAFRYYRFWSLTDEAIASAAGLRITISPANPTLVRDSNGNLSVTVSNSGSLAPWVLASNSEVGDDSLPAAEHFAHVVDLRPYQIEPGKSDTLKLAYRIGAGDPITVPHSEHLYDGRLFSRQATMHVSLKINGVEVSLNAETSFDVVPAIEIASITPSPFVLTPMTPAGVANKRDISMTPRVTFDVKLINHQATAYTGNLLAASNLSDNSANTTPVKLAPSESRTVKITVERQFSKGGPSSANTLKFWLSGLKSVPAKVVPVSTADAFVAPGLRVGYMRGFDFSLPNALAALGVDSKELSVDEVKTADLQKYGTIIVDNRVYESEPALIAVNQRLLDYAKDGGTLVVFYHKSNEWNPDTRRNRPQLAPYPLTLGDARITDENAAITLTEPNHPLLNVPNKIVQDDFKDWIQERGLYYPRQWDPQYHALLSANDPGEAPLTGGLLVADYGKGHYIYTSMVWYRQLRAGVPGGYRMFANMISYGHK
jgi:LmbE family N-acetylglucosaminyl deacetylase